MSIYVIGDLHGTAQRFSFLQAGKRPWATVNQIPNQPERIVGRVKVYCFQQANKFNMAAVQVANDIDTHGHSRLTEFSAVDGAPLDEKAKRAHQKPAGYTY